MDRGGLVRKTRERYDVPWDPHALTFSCYRNRAFLTRDRTRQWFAKALLAAKAKHRFDLWAYVLMPEHVHLLILPIREDYSISRILQSIKQPVARRAMAYLRRHDPDGLKQLATGQSHSPHRFWQDGGGYDRNVRSREELLNIVTYIHGNPVERGLVARPEEWVWSSFRAWEGLADGPIPVDKESFLRATM
jgi:putative transposase